MEGCLRRPVWIKREPLPRNLSRVNPDDEVTFDDHYWCDDHFRERYPQEWVPLPEHLY